jgi:hypothetical protein
VGRLRETLRKKEQMYSTELRELQKKMGEVEF